jgi:lipopolysaccharide biosynthesis glycosyltransferase
MLPWARDEGIEWRWVNRDFFCTWYRSNNPYIATMMDRFRRRYFSQYVIIADADILFLRDLSDLVALIDGRLDVGGVMTHVPPFRDVEGGSHAELWARMFNAFDLPPPILEFEHTGWGYMFHEAPARYSPAYFNSGMVIGTGEALNVMAPLAYPALTAVRSVLDTFFFDQIAFTLMMYKARVNKKLIPIKFNFPNDRFFETQFDVDAQDIAILHYLRTEVVDRDRIFESPESIEAFVERQDLSGSNEQLRSRVEGIHRMLEPAKGFSRISDRLWQ